MAQAKRKTITEQPSEASVRLRESLFEVSCVVFGLLALYVVISLLTYSQTDPGWTHTALQGKNIIDNWGGIQGAYLSDILWHVFGYMSLVLPLLIVGLSVRFFRLRKSTAPMMHSHHLLMLVGFLMMLIGGCGLFDLHFSHLVSKASFLSGGFIGDWVKGELFLQIGSVGATLLLCALFLTGITLLTGLSWFAVMDKLGAGIFSLIAKIQERKEQKSDREIGAKARVDRQATLSMLKEVVTKYEPTIKPKVSDQAKPISSDRSQREKQGTLFSSMQSTNEALPKLSLLDATEEQVFGYSDEALKNMSIMLVKKLADFNIMVKVISVHQGPVITRFEIDPAPGVKAATITGLAKDLARAMSFVSLRVVENIPGSSCIGIEIPNESREIVKLVEGLSSTEFEKIPSPLAIVLGKDIAGNAVIADLAKMPHVLIAGTTGSGKSVCINALILSLLYKASAKEVRMIMVDPKMLELSVYEGIPHLLAPVVTDMSEAANALRWSIVEMERRYKLMSQLGVRNLAGYNRKIQQAREDGAPILDPLVKPNVTPEALQELPCLVVIIDELADLMMSVGKKVEELITRLAQKGRASGVHLILATQRPSVDVITGLLKANIPTRIAFQVSSKVDSRTIIDQMGAEMLLGHGDMLYLPPGTSLPERVHGSFVSDQEVHRVVQSLKSESQPEYNADILQTPKEIQQALPSQLRDDNGTADSESDPLYDQAVEFVTHARKVSISLVQRQLRIGYNRSARMIEAMEASGVITAAQENGKREVLAPPPIED